MTDTGTVAVLKQMLTQGWHLLLIGKYSSVCLKNHWGICEHSLRMLSKRQEFCKHSPNKRFENPDSPPPSKQRQGETKQTLCLTVEGNLVAEEAPFPFLHLGGQEGRQGRGLPGY